MRRRGEARIGRRFPIPTATASAIAVVAAIGQYAVPAVVPVLQRDPDRLADGQWWRLVSPLLVQTLGWHQVLVNIVTLVALGLVAERLLGRWRWIALFVAGTVGGQVAAYAWDEPGGGASIAICGLAGGVVVALLAGRRIPAPRLAVQVTVYYVVALAGWGFGGFLAAALGCLAAAGFRYELDRIGVPGAERIGLAGAATAAVVLTLARDLHGPPLLSGMAVMALLLAVAGAPEPLLADRPADRGRVASAAGAG